MKIVQMAKEHILSLAEIEKQCFAEPWSENALAEEIGNGIFLVAEEEQAVLGYVGCKTVLDEGYITNVAVSPSFRRKGIAAKLIATLLEQAKEKNLCFVTLEARESNHAAISLYAKYGFETVGIRKNFYRKPEENAVLMTYFIR